MADLLSACVDFVCCGRLSCATGNDTRQTRYYDDIVIESDSDTCSSDQREGEKDSCNSFKCVKLTTLPGDDWESIYLRFRACSNQSEEQRYDVSQHSTATPTPDRALQHGEEWADVEDGLLSLETSHLNGSSWADVSATSSSDHCVEDLGHTHKSTDIAKCKRCGSNDHSCSQCILPYYRISADHIPPFRCLGCRWFGFSATEFKSHWAWCLEHSAQVKIRLNMKKAWMKLMCAHYHVAKRCWHEYTNRYALGTKDPVLLSPDFVNHFLQAFPAD
eukprot:TRINITY_DN7670_c0_g1_i2.p1 TRINITY_DN7670_c0_g1~~TRINITY_DN7670_c0_g1_i2.p1  ORF type:complete len:275 (+),score=10.40 TRINITY_DN7670_c0_g1_i2:141-965(+)